MTDVVRRAATHPPVVSLRDLFLAFLQVSLSALGGGMVWARQVLVEQRRWLDEQEFADILSLCQFMPGPNIASMTLCVGARLHGTSGALVSLAGFIVIPWTLGFALGALYLHYAHFGPLQDILRGISAAAAGMVMAVGFKLLTPHRRRPAALLFAALGFAGLAFVRLPLVVVVLVLAPLSIAAAYFERRPIR
ncbi:MAG TPA: chromate transporter [Stellaceae bacterium]|nr:chromate transporter [Stellaceae bacterium]